MINIKKIVLIVFGCIFLGLGVAGTFIPLMPGTPFLMLAFFCFSRSSERIHKWFIGTRLYKANLETFFALRGMTVRTKLRIILIVTSVMSSSFYIVWKKNVLPAMICLGVVWTTFFLYFLFGIRTLSQKEYDDYMKAKKEKEKLEAENENSSLNI